MRKQKTPIDISVSIDENLAVWPGSSPVKFNQCKSINKGDNSNDTEWMASVHVGTHIDAPLHFLKNGPSVDQLDLTRLIGEARVVALPKKREITAADLKKALAPYKNTKRLLLKTDNSRLWKTSPDKFHKDFVALTADAARWVVKQGIVLIGIDYFSIQRFKDGPQVHRTLLRSGVVILESIDLFSVVPGRYDLICLPLKLKGIEAAPVRAVLYPKGVCR